MMNKWITAAAAASALSTAVPASPEPQQPQHVESRPFGRPDSERARIVEIGTHVRRLVARYADADPRSIVAPSALEDLGLSDVALADVALGLEARFDLDIEDAALRNWQTVGDVVDFVARRLREQRA
jgi:acyl carrier protein